MRRTATSHEVSRQCRHSCGCRNLLSIARQKETPAHAVATAFCDRLGWTSVLQSGYFLATVFVLLFALPEGKTFGQEECTVAVASGIATVDGRPLLWKNRDSNHRDNEVAFFQGPRYDFIGVINAGDTTQVWMGLNTAGFAIINSESLDQPGDSVDAEGYFMKQALGICGQLLDFEILLEMTNATGRGTKSNFGCIDAFNGSAFYETGNNSYTKFDAGDATDAPHGYLVRANFSLTGSGQEAYGAGRYQRAKHLFDQAVMDFSLSHRFILQKIARDLRSDELNPYPLPFQGSFAGAPPGFVKTNDSINRHRTVACGVFHGVRRGENPANATMWCILGEPICGIAVPLWPRAGQVPSDLDGAEESRLNRRIEDLRQQLYSRAKWPQYFDSYKLSGDQHSLLPHLLKQENEIMAKAEKSLAEWRLKSPPLREMERVQHDLVSQAMRALR